jgi:hypothetical protein
LAWTDRRAIWRAGRSFWAVGISGRVAFATFEAPFWAIAP